MSEEQAEELGEIRARAREAAEALERRSVEVLELTRRIETLTGGTGEWYPGMRMRVEAQEALRQARVVVRALEDSDEGADVRG